MSLVAPPPLWVGVSPPRVNWPSVMDFLVMKLITPPMASVPYRADAPSRRTSTRSMAANGIMFRSTAPPAELVPDKALLARRRPLSSTSVLFAPMPRMSANDAPPVAAPTEPALLLIDWLPVMRCTSSAVVVTPCLRSSSALRMVIGTAVSASTRRIAEPVTSTRCSCVVGAATVAAAGTAALSSSAACTVPAPIPMATRYNGTKR